jgi:hypothetical protein
MRPRRKLGRVGPDSPHFLLRVSLVGSVRPSLRQLSSGRAPGLFLLRLDMARVLGSARVALAPCEALCGTVPTQHPGQRLTLGLL